MNKRNRAATATDGERSVSMTSKLERRPITSFAPRQHLSEKQRKAMLMKNLLLNVELKEETSKALPKKKGKPSLILPAMRVYCLAMSNLSIVSFKRGSN